MFDFDGKKYAGSSAHQKEWGSRLIGELSLQGDERVLDLGCGDGALTARIAAIVPQGYVLGIDSSPGMIEATKKYQESNLSFALMDINTLSFHEDFDVVFSNATLHWVHDHELLLANIFRSLSPGGVARLNFGGEGNCRNFLRTVKEEMVRDCYLPYFTDFTWPWFMPSENDYRQLVNRFPFREMKVWLENADRYFPNADALTGWIDQPSIVPFLKQIDGPDRQSFRDTVVRRMIDLTRQPDGTFFETFRRINVFARK